MSISPALLELSNVHYLVNDCSKIILKDISFKIFPQSIVTIIGPNGAGKSTLLRLILNLIKPTQGKVILKNGLVVGYMPQKLSITPYFPLTVDKFLKLSFHVQETKIQWALKTVGLEESNHQQVKSLSGGEWQRLLLARALLQKPNLLVLDEPTQGLDITGQSDFYHLLKHLKHELNCAIIQVSHDLHLVWEASDQVICINHHICCHGTPDEVKNHPQTKDLFGGLSFYTHHHDHCHHIKE